MFFSVLICFVSRISCFSWILGNGLCNACVSGQLAQMEQAPKSNSSAQIILEPNMISVLFHIFCCSIGTRIIDVLAVQPDNVFYFLYTIIAHHKNERLAIITYRLYSHYYYTHIDFNAALYFFSTTRYLLCVCVCFFSTINRLFASVCIYLCAPSHSTYIYNVTHRAIHTIAFDKYTYFRIIRVYFAAAAADCTYANGLEDQAIQPTNEWKKL